MRATFEGRDRLEKPDTISAPRNPIHSQPAIVGGDRIEGGRSRGSSLQLEHAKVIFGQQLYGLLAVQRHQSTEYLVLAKTVIDHRNTDRIEARRRVTKRPQHLEER